MTVTTGKKAKIMNKRYRIKKVASGYIAQEKRFFFLPWKDMGYGQSGSDIFSTVGQAENLIKAKMCERVVKEFTPDSSDIEIQRVNDITGGYTIVSDGEVDAIVRYGESPREALEREVKVKLKNREANG